MSFHQFAFGLETGSLEKVRGMSVIAFRAIRFAKFVLSSRDYSIASVTSPRLAISSRKSACSSLALRLADMRQPLLISEGIDSAVLFSVQ
jgi:hypothetical protein